MTAKGGFLFRLTAIHMGQERERYSCANITQVTLAAQAGQLRVLAKAQGSKNASGGQHCSPMQLFWQNSGLEGGVLSCVWMWYLVVEVTDSALPFPERYGSRCGSGHFSLGRSLLHGGPQSAETSLALQG